jgi:hypothetical protein
MSAKIDLNGKRSGSGPESLFETAEKKVYNFVLRHHLSHWHPISTAPSNQNLELSVVDAGEIITLPFPCLHNNRGDWINVDIGIRIRIEPIRWRTWQNDKPAI